MNMVTAEKNFLTILLNQDKTGFKAGETSSKEMINSSSQKKKEEEKEEKSFFKFIDAEKRIWSETERTRVSRWRNFSNAGLIQRIIGALVNCKINSRLIKSKLYNTA